MSKLVDVLFRALLAVLFVGCLVVQVVAGPLAATVVGGASGVVLTTLIVVGGLCVEAVLLSVWMLRGMVLDESIFDGRNHADRWTNTAIGALGIAAALAVGGFVYFLISQASSLSSIELVLAVVLAAAAGTAAALALLVVVMRRLLHTAIQYQSDLSEVI